VADAQPPPHLAARYAAARQRIAEAIAGYDTALSARDAARTPQARARATFYLNRADAEHSAAHAAYAAVLDEWTAHAAAQEPPR
jgi:hypothetical protein